jgi:prepilin-type N-terminal cleavage/methylation domain-containing protein
MGNRAEFLINKASIPRNILRNPKGLSLLETLIAIIILAITLTSISYFFSAARGNIEVSGHMRSGLVLGQDKMEELKDLKDLGYFHADLSEGTHSDRVDSAGDPDADDRPFYREWTVYDIEDPADGTGPNEVDYKLVELKVYDQRLAPGVDPADNNKLVAELKTYISP